MRQKIPLVFANTEAKRVLMNFYGAVLPVPRRPLEIHCLIEATKRKKHRSKRADLLNCILKMQLFELKKGTPGTPHGVARKATTNREVPRR